MGAIAKPHRGRGAGDFLHRHHMLQIAQAQAAKFFFHRDAVQAQRAHFRPEMAGKFIGGVIARGKGRDLFAGETAHRLAQHVRGLAQAEIQLRAHSRSPCEGPGFSVLIDGNEGEYGFGHFRGRLSGEIALPGTRPRFSRRFVPPTPVWRRPKLHRRYGRDDGKPRRRSPPSRRGPHSRGRPHCWPPDPSCSSASRRTRRHNNWRPPAWL